MRDRIKDVINQIKISKDIYEFNDYKKGYNDEYLKFLFKTNGIPKNFADEDSIIKQNEEIKRRGPLVNKKIKLVCDEYRIFVESLKTKEEDLNKVLEDVFDIDLPVILRTTRKDDFPTEMPLQVLLTGSKQQRKISQEFESIESGDSILIDKDEIERTKITIESYKKIRTFYQKTFLKYGQILSQIN